VWSLDTGSIHPLRHPGAHLHGSPGHSVGGEGHRDPRPRIPLVWMEVASGSGGWIELTRVVPRIWEASVFPICS
jgi:hypothetical protein